MKADLIFSVSMGLNHVFFLGKHLNLVAQPLPSQEHPSTHSTEVRVSDKLCVELTGHILFSVFVCLPHAAWKPRSICSLHLMADSILPRWRKKCSIFPGFIPINGNWLKHEWKVFCVVAVHRDAYHWRQHYLLCLITPTLWRSAEWKFPKTHTIVFTKCWG